MDTILTLYGDVINIIVGHCNERVSIVMLGLTCKAAQQLVFDYAIIRQHYTDTKSLRQLALFLGFTADIKSRPQKCIMLSVAHDLQEIIEWLCNYDPANADMITYYAMRYNNWEFLKVFLKTHTVKCPCSAAGHTHNTAHNSVI